MYQCELILHHSDPENCIPPLTGYHYHVHVCSFQYLSTSPEQESPGFEAHVREAMIAIRDNPEPLKTLFPDKQPRMYKKEASGAWTKL